MTSSSRIVRYDSADRDEVFAFWERIYSPADNLRFRRRWDWKYEENPFNLGGTPTLLLLKKDDALIGMLGMVPHAVAIEGVVYPMVPAGDLAVDPAFRGHHLAGQLIDAHLNTHPLGFGWLNDRSHRSAAGVKRTDWLHVTPLLKPLAPLALLSSFLNSHSKRVVDHPSVISPAFGQATFPCKIYQDITVTRMDHFDARFDLFWESVKAEFQVIGVRDSIYLNWRYTRRPDVTYVILMATRANQVIGYLVLRCIERDGLRRGYFVDFLAHPADLLPLRLLIQSGVEYLHTEGVAAIQCLVTVPKLVRVFYPCGFIPQKFGRRPYFHTHNEISDPLSDISKQARNWFLTMGDGDLEMSI